MNTITIRSQKNESSLHWFTSSTRFGQLETALPFTEINASKNLLIYYNSLLTLLPTAKFSQDKFYDEIGTSTASFIPYYNHFIWFILLSPYCFVRKKQLLDLLVNYHLSMKHVYRILITLCRIMFETFPVIGAK